MQILMYYEMTLILFNQIIHKIQYQECALRA